MRESCHGARRNRPRLLGFPFSDAMKSIAAVSKASISAFASLVEGSELGLPSILILRACGPQSRAPDLVQLMV